MRRPSSISTTIDLVGPRKIVWAIRPDHRSPSLSVPAGAVSRSLVLLEERKLISVEQTRTRGRAAIAKLTAEGRKLSEKLLKVSREREARLFKNFGRADREHLKALLEQLSGALADADWDH